ncbi:MAG TPA: hypothetical protein VHJ77_08010 [Vicinamibacterales bacterium]|nr:hypothetical protein [Vicinamibacterales bacterium]
MEVYLVPAGGSRYELYCEVADPSPDVDDDEARPGFVRKITARFRELLATAEREHRERQAARDARAHDAHGTSPAEPTFARRIRDRTLRWMAESIAEQRLLWHLRRCEEARFIYPQDLSERDALDTLMTQLRGDFERHRRWFVIDLVLFIASGAAMLIPGPNVLAYYFLFRFVGHFLSMRGARQGLQIVAWRPESSLALTELRQTLSLDRESREPRLRDIAARLRLEHLASFVQRIAQA